MIGGLGIERYKDIQSGEDFTLPEGWKSYAYKCVDGSTVTITNQVGESITDEDTGGTTCFTMFGCQGVIFSASGSGYVRLKYII